MNEKSGNGALNIYHLNAIIIYPQKYPSPYLLLIPGPQMKTLYPIYSQ